MYQWRPLITQGLYRLLFIGALLATLYLLFNQPSNTSSGVINDKVAHALAFFILTLFIHRGMPENYGLKIFIAMCAFGLLTEVVQYFLPWRSFSLADWFADIVGILCYYCLHLVRSRFVKIIRAENNV